MVSTSRLKKLSNIYRVIESARYGQGTIFLKEGEEISHPIPLTNYSPLSITKPAQIIPVLN